VASTTAAVIPARFASTRFPGKPLALISGVPMIVWVARAAQRAERVDRVLVATDDERIHDAVVAAGFEAVMTDPDLPSGSDRVAAAVDTLDVAPDLIVNVQGDEPLLDPVDLDVLIAAAERQAIGTLARPFEDASRVEDPNVVKVARAESGRALYFSRAPIPYGASSYLQHVGIYAYPPAVLKRFVSLSPSPLERAERLEQLRAMENQIPIQVTLCQSSSPSIGVDTPADLERVEDVLRRSNLSPSGMGHAPQAAS
jgi:3-deoxy-manno-octulosonate cytidylyltransferase (CMP-KDO synthetase)